MNLPKRILPVIVVSQFCCTSLWFASNGVMSPLIENFNLPEGSISHLTSAVQLGFITGTLLFAILTLADRFSPSKVFFFSAVVGSLFNLAVVWEGNTFSSLLLLRFFTGFMLAGIYPVGMKIAADYYEKGLGKSLGFLVGALVIGTSFPHLLNGYFADFSWKLVIISTTILAIMGGSMMFFLVPDGPFRKAGKGVDFAVIFKVFKNRKFRAAAFGYFGHMWELYAFWVFVPILLQLYNNFHPEAELNIPFWSFVIIGMGGFSCVLGAYIAQRAGTKRVAFMALLFSCICCLSSPWLFSVPSQLVFLGFLIFWGMTVVADSPLFSTLVANNAEPETKGTALTIVNCIGFAISILSIQLLQVLNQTMNPIYIYAILAVGPVLGLMALSNKKPV
jgi:MFS family permease